MGSYSLGRYAESALQKLQPVLGKKWRSKIVKGFSIRYDPCWSIDHDNSIDVAVGTRFIEHMSIKPTKKCPLNQNGNWWIGTGISPNSFGERKMKVQTGSTVVTLFSDKANDWHLDVECNGLPGNQIGVPSFYFYGKMESSSAPDQPPSVFEAFARGIRCDSIKRPNVVGKKKSE